MLFREGLFVGDVGMEIGSPTATRGPARTPSVNVHAHGKPARNMLASPELLHPVVRALPRPILEQSSHCIQARGVCKCKLIRTDLPKFQSFGDSQDKAFILSPPSP